VRMSDLAAKEIVNLLTGERLGAVGECDLVLDEESGRIRALALPARRGLWLSRPARTIAWEAVRRIGPEVVIVELEEGTGGGPVG
jgi:YlmC/YmxH family sporulation protein